MGTFVCILCWHFSDLHAFHSTGHVWVTALLVKGKNEQKKFRVARDPGDSEKKNVSMSLQKQQLIFPLSVPLQFLKSFFLLAYCGTYVAEKFL